MCMRLRLGTFTATRLKHFASLLSYRIITVDSPTTVDNDEVVRTECTLEAGKTYFKDSMKFSVQNPH